MAGSASTMRIAERWFGVLERLPQPPDWIEARILAKRLRGAQYDTDPRTTKRDLEAMLASGRFGIEVDRTCKPLRWRWKTGAAPIKVAARDRQVAIFVALAHPLLRQVQPPGVLAHMEPIHREALATLDKTGGADFVAKVRGLPELLPRARREPDERCMATLVEALSLGQRVRAMYRKLEAEQHDEYALEPLGLVQAGPTLMIVASKVGRSIAQNFEAQRFAAVELLEGAATGPEGFDLDEYIASGELAWRLGEPIDLEVEVSGVYRMELEEAPLAPGQRVDRLPDGRLLVRMTQVPDTMALQRFLLGMGASAKVVGPPAYAARLRAEVAAMARMHDVGGRDSGPEERDLARGVLVPADARSDLVREVLAEVAWHLGGWARSAGGRVLGPGAAIGGETAGPDFEVYGPGKRPDLDAPDLAVDVLTPASQQRRARMASRYMAAGIPEWWLVDPVARTAERRCRVPGGWRAVQLLEEGTLESSLGASLPLDALMT